MFYAMLKLVHLLSVVVWVGGMVFAHFFLRPALTELEPPAKVRLMTQVLSRFLNTVLVLSSLTVLSGGWMLGRIAKSNLQAGAPFHMTVDFWVMSVLGVLMWLVFAYVRFVRYPQLHRAVAGLDWSAANHRLAQIRHGVLVNLVMGMIVISAVVIGGAS